MANQVRESRVGEGNRAEKKQTEAQKLDPQTIPEDCWSLYKKKREQSSWDREDHCSAVQRVSHEPMKHLRNTSGLLISSPEADGHQCRDRLTRETCPITPISFIYRPRPQNRRLCAGFPAMRAALQSLSCCQISPSPPSRIRWDWYGKGEGALRLNFQA